MQIKDDSIRCFALPQPLQKQVNPQNLARQATNSALSNQDILHTIFSRLSSWSDLARVREVSSTWAAAANNANVVKKIAQHLQEEPLIESDIHSAQKPIHQVLNRVREEVNLVTPNRFFPKKFRIMKNTQHIFEPLRFLEDGRLVSFFKKFLCIEKLGTQLSPPMLIGPISKTRKKKYYFSENGKKLFIVDNTFQATLFDLDKNSARTLILAASVGPIQFAVFSPNTEYLITVSLNMIYLWDLRQNLPNAQAIAPIALNHLRKKSIAFSYNAKYLIFMENYKIYLFAINDLLQTSLVTCLSDNIQSVSFSPNGKYLTAIDYQGKLFFLAFLQQFISKNSS